MSISGRVFRVFVAALALFAIAIDFIGFYESAFLFLLLTSWLLSVNEKSPRRRLAGAAVFAAIFVMIVFVAFKLILKIPTPVGLIV